MSKFIKVTADVWVDFDDVNQVIFDDSTCFVDIYFKNKDAPMNVEITFTDKYGDPITGSRSEKLFNTFKEDLFNKIQ